MPLKKIPLLRSLALTAAVLFFWSVARATPSPDVNYDPVVKIAQGNQPYDETYDLEIAAPDSLIANVSVPVGFVITPLTKPAGVSDATAKSYVTLSTNILTFNQPNQPLTIQVRVKVDLGSPAGAYSWKISTLGWPSLLGVDGGHTINGVFTAPGSVDTSTPSIVINSPDDGHVYTYLPASGTPVTVPVSFTATVGTNGSPISLLQAVINGNAVPFVGTGLNTLSASGAGSVQLTMPGTYTISASAKNDNGTSTDKHTITVNVSAPPPTITPSTPTANSSFSFIVGSAGASVPLSFSANSVYGNVTALSATLDGTPVTLGLSGVGTSTTASGSASLTVGTTGSHSLVLSASNDYGDATPVTIPFTVTSVAPAPTLTATILTPASGTAFSRVAGDPATIVNYSFIGSISSGAITSVKVTLDGTVITPAALGGLGTAIITGSGAMSFTAGGTHTLNLTVSNGSASASGSGTFTINQSQPQPSGDLIWLPPISLNKTIEGGCMMPIKFTLSHDCKFIRDTTILIAIYEVYTNGSHSNPAIYHYGSGSNPNPPDYAISGKEYQLNFTTATGVHSYHIEVYSSASGPMRLLGSKVLNTSRKKSGGGRDHDDHDDDDRDDGSHSGCNDGNDRDGHR